MVPVYLCDVVKEMPYNRIGFYFFIKSIHQFFYVFSILDVFFHFQKGNGLENSEIRNSLSEHHKSFLLNFLSEIKNGIIAHNDNNRNETINPVDVPKKSLKIAPV